MKTFQGKSCLDVNGFIFSLEISQKQIQRILRAEAFHWEASIEPSFYRLFKCGIKILDSLLDMGLFCIYEQLEKNNKLVGKICSRTKKVVEQFEQCLKRAMQSMVWNQV